MLTSARQWRRKVFGVGGEEQNRPAEGREIFFALPGEGKFLPSPGRAKIEYVSTSTEFPPRGLGSVVSSPNGIRGEAKLRSKTILMDAK